MSCIPARSCWVEVTNHAPPFLFSPGNYFATYYFATHLSTLFSAWVLFTPQASRMLSTLQTVFPRDIFLSIVEEMPPMLERLCRSSVQTRVSLDFCRQAMICNYGKTSLKSSLHNTTVNASNWISTCCVPGEPWGAGHRITAANHKHCVCGSPPLTFAMFQR